ncbi:MAG: sensor histidine kinase [Coprobacillaceae bacterium]
MFKKLRNKFLILNVISILIVLIAAFASIFYMTYENVRKDVTLQLEKELKEKNFRPPNSIGHGPNSQQPLDFASTSFCVLLNTDNELEGIYNTPFTISNDDVEPLITKAIDKNKDLSFFENDGQYWAFQLVESSDGNLLAFVNITSNVNVLLNLVYAFLVVSILVTCVIVILSYKYANRAIQPIKESFKRQEEFVANASHELKTPLTIINTTLNVIRSNQDETVQQQDKWLDYIQNETNRMSTLTNDLLYLTRMSQTNDILLTTFNISELIETTILSMEAIAYEKDVTLSYTGFPMQYHGHMESLNRLFYILLDNAIKYNNKDGYVKVVLTKQQKTITITIENSGEGIEEEHIKRIFNRFYRADESRNSQTGGYGIGLSIAKTIVEQHNGIIKVESELQKSTTFSVTLPIT